jgi:Phage integrase, N-terminal SAM-like domain
VGPKRVTLKSGEVRWEIRYNDAGRSSAYRRRRFGRREDAQTFLDEMRRRRRLGELAESEWARRTVRELALDWWALHVLPTLSARTQRDYRKLLDRHIIKRLGAHRLRDVTVTVVDDFKAKLLAAGVGESQTRQALAVLSGMFTYAERRGRVSKNPVRLVTKPSSRRKRAVVCLAPSAVELARAICLRRRGTATPRSCACSHTRDRSPRRRSRLSGGTCVSGRSRSSRRTSTARSWRGRRPGDRHGRHGCGRRSATTCSPGRCAPGAAVACLPEPSQCSLERVGLGKLDRSRVEAPSRQARGHRAALWAKALVCQSANPGGRIDHRAGGGARAQPADDAQHICARDR